MNTGTPTDDLDLVRDALPGAFNRDGRLWTRADATYPRGSTFAVQRLAHSMRGSRWVAVEWAEQYDPRSEYRLSVGMTLGTAGIRQAFHGLA